MALLTGRPTLYNIVISTREQAVEFTVPSDANWIAIKARDDIVWSTVGTVGDPIGAPYSELDAGETFSLPDVQNILVAMVPRLYFAVPAGATIPAVVEVAAS